MVAPNPSEDGMAPDEFNSFQEDILQHGKMIEKYIIEESRKKPSDKPTKILNSLFDIFRTELKMNLLLRRALISKDDSNNSAAVSINSFLQEISTAYGGKFKSLNEVLISIKPIILSSRLKPEKSSEDQEIEARAAIEIAERLSKAESAASDCDRLRAMLEEAKKSLSESQSESISLRKQNSELIQKVVSAQKERDSAFSELADLKKCHRDTSNRLNSVLSSLQSLENSQQKAIEEMRQRYEARVKWYRRRIIELQGHSSSSLPPVTIEVDSLRPITLAIMTCNRMLSRISPKDRIKGEVRSIESEISGLRNEVLHLGDSYGTS